MALNTFTGGRRIYILSSNSTTTSTPQTRLPHRTSFRPLNRVSDFVFGEASAAFLQSRARTSALGHTGALRCESASRGCGRLQCASLRPLCARAKRTNLQGYQGCAPTRP